MLSLRLKKLSGKLVGLSNLSSKRLLLVGDNPFLNISHLSQQKARDRAQNPSDSVYASRLLRLALENGANGFTFSVCDSNLAILNNLKLDGLTGGLGLYPIVPYAFEYVQKATQSGGISGLVKKLGWEMVKSGNVESLYYGALASARYNPSSLLKAYLSYEISRLASIENDQIRLESVLLHQLVTDMALALDMDWLFKEFIRYLKKKKVMPGLNTGNFVSLVNKFNEWGLDLQDVLIFTPFNKVGFQVIPSIDECEKTLRLLPLANVIAISILAAGYIRPKEALEYIASLPNIKGIAVGVSKETHTSIFDLSSHLLC